MARRLTAAQIALQSIIHPRVSHPAHSFLHDGATDRTLSRWRSRSYPRFPHGRMSIRTLTPTLSRFAVEGASETDRTAQVPSTAKRERVRVRVCSADPYP